MNGQSPPPMLAYEMAMHQRAQSQGRNAHIYHSPPPHAPQHHQPQQQFPQQNQQQHHPMHIKQQHAPWGAGGTGPPPHAQGINQQQQQQQQWHGQQQQPRNTHPLANPNVQQPSHGHHQSNNQCNGPPHQYQQQQQQQPQPPYQNTPQHQPWAGNVMPATAGAPHPRVTAGQAPPGVLPAQGGRGGGSGTPWGNNSHRQQQQIGVCGGDGGPTGRPPGTGMRALGGLQPGSPNSWQSGRPVNNRGGNGFGGVSGTGRTVPNAQQVGDGGAPKKKMVKNCAVASRPDNPKVSGDGKTEGGGGSGVIPCGPCEREFTSEGARAAHLQSHVPCPEPGCEFSALRKVVNTHHEVKHGQFNGAGFQTIDVEGQKFQVLLGTNPKEVEQWRAARRSRWPTDQNKARKEEEHDKRKALGDLGPDPGPTGRGRGRGRGRGGGRGGRGHGVDRPSTGDDALATGKRGVGDVQGETPSKVAKVEGGGDGAGSAARAGAGKKLCTFYLKGRCGKGEECTFSHDVERKNCSYFMAGRCHRGKRCLFMHDVEARAAAQLAAGEPADGSPGSGEGEERPAKPSKTKKKATSVVSKPTLLRKLLTPQLHRESSIALQAMRFIVSSNFFLDAVPGASPAKKNADVSVETASVAGSQADGASVPMSDGDIGIGAIENKGSLKDASTAPAAAAAAASVAGDGCSGNGAAAAASSPKENADVSLENAPDVVSSQADDDSNSAPTRDECVSNGDDENSGRPLKAASTAPAVGGANSDSSPGSNSADGASPPVENADVSLETPSVVRIQVDGASVSTSDGDIGIGAIEDKGSSKDVCTAPAAGGVPSDSCPGSQSADATASPEETASVSLETPSVAAS